MILAFLPLLFFYFLQSCHFILHPEWVLKWAEGRDGWDSQTEFQMQPSLLDACSSSFALEKALGTQMHGDGLAFFRPMWAA